MQNQPAQNQPQATQQPIYPPPPPQVKPNQTGFQKNRLLTLGAILLLLIVATFTIYLYIQNQSNQKQSITGDLPENDESCMTFRDLEEAKSSPEKVCILDLSAKGLPEIPENVYSFPNLKGLNFASNALSVFPTKLFEIESLVSIDLRTNNINSIPQGFVVPDHIQILKLKENSLSSSDLETYERNPEE